MHLVWDPSSGVLVQMLSAERTGLYRAGLPKGANKGAIEILVLGEKPFTSGPLKGLAEIMDWLRSLEIPDAFPLGPATDTPRVSELPGHYPINVGAIDNDRILGSGVG